MARKMSRVEFYLSTVGGACRFFLACHTGAKLCYNGSAELSYDEKEAYRVAARHARACALLAPSASSTIPSSHTS